VVETRVEYHLARQSDPEESIRIISERGSMKESIFSITAGTTTEERAEIRMGKALREGYRQKAFFDDQGRWSHQDCRSRPTK